MLEKRFRELYGDYCDSEKSIKDFEKVFLNLKSLKAQDLDEVKMLLLIKSIEEEDEEIPDWHDVSGFDETEKMLYSLVDTRWEKWLGIKIHPDTLQNYDPKDIIIHCLWEMTFYGYTQEIIQAYFRDFREGFDKELAEDMKLSSDGIKLDDLPENEC